MTDVFAKKIWALENAPLPPSAIAAARMRFLDYLGVVLAGARLLGSHGKALAETVERGDVPLIGLGRRCTSHMAALLNGMAAHAAEMDDGHRGGGVHVGGTVFSALLAAACRERVTADAFLRGAIAGYEATVRCALALRPGHRRRGFHATGTCGTVGASAAVATMLRFDEGQMKSALSAAAAAASGFLEMQEDDSEMKPFNMGQSAMSGLASADVGRAGFRPPHDAFGGARGFLALLTDTPNPEKLIADSDGFAVDEVYVKTHSACRHAHAAIDCALALRTGTGFDWKRISSVEVHTYAAAVNGHDHVAVAGVNAAKMSIPFAVASALATGRTGLDAYSVEAVGNDSVLDLAARMRVIADDLFTARAPAVRGAELRVTLDNGQVLRSRVDHPKGEPENPLSVSEIERKFTTLAMFAGLDTARCARLIDLVGEDNFDLGSILEVAG